MQVRRARDVIYPSDTLSRAQQDRRLAHSRPCDIDPRAPTLCLSAAKYVLPATALLTRCYILRCHTLTTTPNTSHTHLPAQMFTAVLRVPASTGDILQPCRPSTCSPYPRLLVFLPDLCCAHRLRSLPEIYLYVPVVPCIFQDTYQDVMVYMPFLRLVSSNQLLCVTYSMPA